MMKPRGVKMTSGSGPLYGPQCTVYSTMSRSRSEPTIMNVGTSESASDISWLMSWAAERKPPSSEYLLFDASPPMTIAYTLSALTAKMTKMPTLTSATQYWTLYQSPMGMTTQARNAATTAMPGATT